MHGQVPPFVPFRQSSPPPVPPWGGLDAHLAGRIEILPAILKQAGKEALHTILPLPTQGKNAEKMR